MDQQEIISRLDQLLPRIKESGDPESVMLKFARDNNLAPAQLEKLGQVYNTAKTLNFMSKAANRGGVFRLLDNEAMLSKYVTHDRGDTRAGNPISWVEDWRENAPIEKAASEADPDDIESWIDREPVKQASMNGHEFPDIISEIDSRTVLEKAASLSDEIDAIHVASVQTWREKQATAVEIEYVESVIDDQKDALRKKFASLRDAVREGMDWAEFEEDALDLFGTSAEPVLNMAADYLKSSNTQVTRFDAAAARDRRMAYDRTGFAGVVKAASTDLDLLAAALRYRGHVKAATTAAPPQKAKPKPAPTREEGAGEPDLDDVGTKPESSGGGGKPPGGAAPKPKGEEGADRQPKPKGKAPAPAAGGGEGGSNALRENFDQLLAGIQAGGRLGKDKSSPLFFESVGSPLKMHADLVSQIAPKTNKRQIARDDAANDAQSLMTVQRLMVSDPIISEADPEMVISLYNTIRQANPAFAQDINRLRMAMREAIQYEALPIHTLKDLIGMDVDQQKAVQGRAANRSDAYSL